MRFRRVALLTAALCLLPLLPVLAQAAAPQEAASTANADQKTATGYLRKLQLPIRGDQFRQPRAIHADLHTGEIFVCDTFNNRLVVFDHRGLFRHQIIGGGIFRTPMDVAVDPRGLILVLALSTAGRGIVLLDFDGRPMGHLQLSGLPADTAEPKLTSIALSTDGKRLFAVDEANYRLWIAQRDGTVISSIDFSANLSEEETENLILGHVDVYGETVLMSKASAGRVQLFDLDGESRGEFGFKGTATCETAMPVAAALDADGKVIVLDKQRALFMRWNPETNECLAEYSGFGNVPGALYQPGDLTLDDSGALYVSQGFEGRLQVFRAETTAPPLVEPLEWTAAIDRSPTGEGELSGQLAESEEARAQLAERLAAANSDNDRLEALVVKLESDLRGVRDVSTPAPEPPQPEPAGDLAATLTSQVRAWAQAWSDQRVADYLSFYGQEFQPPGGSSRSAWEALRSSRLLGPELIQVTIEDLRIEQLSPSRARARFRQEYRSNRYADVVRKTLVLGREGAAWKILEESSEPID